MNRRYHFSVTTTGIYVYYSNWIFCRRKILYLNWRWEVEGWTILMQLKTKINTMTFINVSVPSMEISILRIDDLWSEWLINWALQIHWPIRGMRYDRLSMIDTLIYGCHCKTILSKCLILVSIELWLIFLQFFTLMKDFSKVDSPGIGWNNYSTKQKNPWVILWLCMGKQHPN